jgi:hypothetical protein
MKMRRIRLSYLPFAFPLIVALTISSPTNIYATACNLTRSGIVSFCQSHPLLSRLLDVVWPDSSPYQIAVVAGIANYPNLPIGQQLPPVDYDIDTLTNLLRDQFGFDEVIVLRDKGVSQDNLRYLLSQYIPTQLMAHNKSQVLFAYSGHGADYGNNGYIFLSDTRTIDPHSYDDLERAIDLDELKILMKPTASLATHFLVLLNSCKGGYFVQGGTFAFGANALDARGAHGITAGGRANNVHAFENVGSGKGSVFFEMLFSALRGSGVNVNGVFIPDPAGDDGMLNTLKLADFLSRTIQKIENYGFGPQMGRLYGPSRGDDGEGYFFFVTNQRNADETLRKWYPNRRERILGPPPPGKQAPSRVDQLPGLYARLNISMGALLNADMFEVVTGGNQPNAISDDAPLSFAEDVRGACLDLPLNKGQKLIWQDLRIDCQ